MVSCNTKFEDKNNNDQNHIRGILFDVHRSYWRHTKKQAFVGNPGAGLSEYPDTVSSTSKHATQTTRRRRPRNIFTMSTGLHHKRISRSRLFPRSRL